jgi:hypothetical protein
MSSELESGLSSITSAEFMSAIMHVHLKQNDIAESRIMFKAFNDAYPELVNGLTMLDVIADGSELSPDQKEHLFQGVMIGLIALKEVVEVRKLNEIAGG